MFIICVSYLFILYVSGGTGLPALLLAVLRALSMSVLGSALVLMALDTSSTSVVLALVDIGSTGSDILALDTGALVLPLPVPFLPLRLPLPLIVATAMDRATLPRGATGKWGTFIYLTFSLSLYIYIYIQYTSTTYVYYMCLLSVYIIRTRRHRSVVAAAGGTRDYTV